MRRLAVVASCVAALAGPAGARAAGESAPGEGEPPLRMAMSGAFQPFSTTDQDGRLQGFDADIAREIGRRLGRDVELVQVDWAGIQASLQQGKVDLICGSMAITDERRHTMRFSLPYYVSGAQLFLTGARRDVEGARLGVTEDSTYERYIAAHPERFADVEVVRYGSEAEIVAALATDKVDGFVSDRIVGGFYLQRGGTTSARPAGPLLYREACGIAARLDSAALVREVNRALFAMVEDGTYGRIYASWVGEPPDVEVLWTAWATEAAHLAPPGEEGGAGAVGGTPAFADRLRDMVPLLIDGARLTALLSGITALLALLFGAVLGVLAISRAPGVRAATHGLITLVRGTPLLVQLFLSYFALATVLNRLAGAEVMGAFGAALVALVVNTTAYHAETWRGALLAVDRGQWDAAASLGMSRSLTLRRVILPQAFRIALPSLGNNVVVLIKDTSLVGAITLVELTYAARNVVFQTGQPFLPFAVAGLGYLVLIGAVSAGVGALERWLAASRGGSGR